MNQPIRVPTWGELAARGPLAMTAEVAVMNKSAIALAADSAVTTGEETGPKVFNTANKLFALSKYRPVGVMIFGNAEFMAVPWETIIKFYRSRLANVSFAHLTDYAHHFLDFLQQEQELLWPPQIQEQFFTGTIAAYFQFILDEINGEVSKTLSAGEPLPEPAIIDLASEIIKRHREEWDQADPLSQIPPGQQAEIEATYRSRIDEALARTFQSLPLQPPVLADLRSIAAQLFSKKRFSDSASGLVIAGFGEEEIFPTAVTYALEGVINGRLKYDQADLATASRENSASILPFAQSEMVNTFMEGIDPSLKKAVDAYLQELITSYPHRILDAIPDLPPERRQALATILVDTAKEVSQGFDSEIQAYIHVRHIQPVLDAVAALPKDELAAMAEALVNLTSFKKRVTLETETVGGPIDVAVISKGDGFIWIKRKHYFRPDLNQSFFANYYREG